jgi:hypothetical protein
VHVTDESIAAHTPFFTTIIFPSFNVINPSFNACFTAADEVSATAGVVDELVSVEVVDDLEPSLHANVKLVIATINNSFFMICIFSFISTQIYVIYS